VHVQDFSAETTITSAKAKACNPIVRASHVRRGLKGMLGGSQVHARCARAHLDVSPAWAQDQRDHG
jgi:hypothetical protein